MFDVLVRFQYGILNQVSPGTIITVSLHNLPISPLEFLEYHLLSFYFSFTYPVDILGSARHSLDQSDSHISLQFGVRYVLKSEFGNKGKVEF